MSQADPDPTDILARLPRRLHEAVFSRSPDAPALEDATGAWCFAELHKAALAGAKFLEARGVRPGDRVAIVTENARETAALILACSVLDAWAVLLNARLTQAEIDTFLAHARPRLTACVLTSPQSRAHAQVLALYPEDIAGLGRIAIGDTDASSEAEPVHHDAASQTAVLIYTSGSSGTPKGVMLSHRNLLYMAATSGAIRGLSPADRLLAVLPISHIVGLSVVFLGALMHGASVRLMLRFSPASFLKLLATDGISVVLGAPALLALLLDHARQHLLARITAPHLRIISVSGAPLEQALKDEAENLFGIPLHHGYGITECGPTIAQIRPGAERPDCAVGPLLPGVEARLLDSGELCVRSPGVMLGYYRDEARTREVLDEAGWFCTGDLARLDDGNLIIAGRAKDLIIRFGFNVIPEEVEAVLAAHPDVSRAAVIGKPGDAGEDILAFIVPRAGCSLQTQALAQHAAAHLASYKRPTCYIVVPDLPLTPTGKIEKRALLTIANDAACLREAV